VPGRARCFTVRDSGETGFRRANESGLQGNRAQEHSAYGPVHRNGGPTASWASCDGRYAGQAPRVMEGFTAPPFITGLEHPCRLLVLKLHLIAQGLGHRCHAPERLGGSSNIRGSAAIWLRWCPRAWTPWTPRWLPGSLDGTVSRVLRFVVARRK